MAKISEISLRKKTCYFCVNKAIPDYKDVEILERFTTERGKITTKLRSGVCSAHQRQLAAAIKRARSLALMVFVPTIK